MFLFPFHQQTTKTDYDMIACNVLQLILTWTLPSLEAKFPNEKVIGLSIFKSIVGMGLSLSRTGFSIATRIWRHLSLAWNWSMDLGVITRPVTVATRITSKYYSFIFLLHCRGFFEIIVFLIVYFQEKIVTKSMLINDEVNCMAKKLHREVSKFFECNTSNENVHFIKRRY